MKRFKKAKMHIEQNFKEDLKHYHTETSSGKTWKNLTETLVLSKDRKIYVSNFRKITGHDLLYKHLHRIGVVTSPTGTKFHMTISSLI